MEEGQEIVPRPKYLYVGDVLKSERMVFYRLPKLGCYMAIPLVIKSCLHISSLELGIEERKKFIQSREEYLKVKEQKLV